MKLNLCCSDQRIDGFIGVDLWTPPWATDENFVKADLRHSWPFADNSVDFIRAHDALEHLPDAIHTMNELYRVLKPGGTVEIVVPTTEGRGAWQDPTHVSFWNRNSFFYYESGNPHNTRFREAYGIKCEFAVLAEKEERIADGVTKLHITLQAGKGVAPVEVGAEFVPAKSESAKTALSRLLTKVVSPQGVSVALLACFWTVVILGICPSVFGATLQTHTAPSARNDVDVFSAQEMPAFAMSRISQWTALYVYDVSDRLQVGGVDTMPNAALVIQFQAIGHRPNAQFVRDNVGLLHAPSVVSVPISFTVYVSSPEPARFGFVHLAPESFRHESTFNHTRYDQRDFWKYAFSNSCGKRLIRHSTAWIARPFCDSLNFPEGFDRFDGLPHIDHFTSREWLA